MTGAWLHFLAANRSVPVPLVGVGELAAAS